ncbi:MAG: ATP-binding protein, partial [Cyanobacteria bacterium J06649_4]
VLLLSLADAGKMSLRQNRVDIGEVLALLAEDIELLDPTLPVKVDMDADLIVKGDRDLLTQVLQNLIDNAIKHNLPETSARRWLKVEGRRQGKTVAITVANASQSIPEEERDRIFDRFYRGDVSRNRKREGFGLGLSLSREIARAHRGDLRLEKTPRGETAFTFTLPAEQLALSTEKSIEKQSDASTKQLNSREDKQKTLPQADRKTDRKTERVT